MNEYPQPVPVIAVSLILRSNIDPWKIIVVDLREGGVALPGGIREVWRDQTISECRDAEILQEVGDFTGIEPRLLFIDVRTKKDQREWCGIRTTHCCDFIYVADVDPNVELNPTDTEEIRRARWADLRRTEFRDFIRGHDAVLLHYLNFVQHGANGLPPDRLIE